MRTTIFIIDEDEAKHVRRIFQLSLEGNGGYTIANIFNDEGIPTKFSKNFKGKMKRKDKYTNEITYFNKSEVKWRGNVISEILRNKIYKGVREWNRYEDKIENIDGKPVKTKKHVELITAKVPHIIEPELWEKVQSNLALNKKKVGKRTSYKYLLNGLIVCHHCSKKFVGKKRLASRDNSYKCKGKVYPNSDCKHSRAININKLDSFIIKHLFKSKDLKTYLDSLPKRESEHSGLQVRLNNEKEKLNKIEKELKRGYDLLFGSFKDDKEVETRVNKLKERKNNQEVLVNKLENEVMLSMHSFREARTNRLINEYTDELDFDDVKKLVHSLIESITIGHHKEEGKMGTFILNVKYMGYDEVSTFMTNWTASKWHWTSRYRASPTSKEELEEDRESAIALLKHYGVYDIEKSLKAMQKEKELTDDEVARMNPYSESYEGSEIIEGIYELIELSPEEIVYFD